MVDASAKSMVDAGAKQISGPSTPYRARLPSLLLADHGRLEAVSRALHRRYDERLYVPLTWWLNGSLIALAVWWVLFVSVSVEVAVGGGVVVLGLVAAALTRYGAARVVVDVTGLHVGKAHLPWQYVGPVESLDAQQTRRVLGVEADARAFLVMRPYCPGSVRVRLDDDADPTPYWVVSTRNATGLASSLNITSVQD